ncbi:FAD-dependent oxidoreductase [Dactylosporangium sp. CA-139066]|uniref:FAD-dependent oxidoreductase n=1 Tax=Dactylosporangium sp. CA-139066 TaxID=3239930 RepID=UPI003D92C8F5
MKVKADVCIVGGGPAGLVLALILGRRGVDAVVLEKHGSFLRDFRGDTVHPSTLQLMDELGLGEELAALPHRVVRQLQITYAGGTFRPVDFARLRATHPYVMMLPQWDFLELLATHGEFTLHRNAEVVSVNRSDRRVAGVTAMTPDGTLEVEAPLTVACDGRNSTVRRELGLRSKEYGAPIDILWFRLPREPGDPEGMAGRADEGRLFFGIDRGEYWQMGWVVLKGGDEQIRAAGLPAFRAALAESVPYLADRVAEIRDWDQVQTLTVRMDRLYRWHVPGALLIGDAAHAMSPVGGVGINLAIQDAVAAARVIVAAFERGRAPTQGELASVQRRRSLPTAGTQLIQRAFQRGVLAPALSGRPMRPPLPVRLLDRYPALGAIPARLIGVGLRPEHVA